MDKIELGDKVKDLVTGFEGIAVGKATYLTGCDQIVVDPGCDEKGVPKETFTFDINRLEVLEKKVVVLNKKKEKKEVKGADFDITKVSKRV